LFSWAQWLTPVIPATEETEIGRIVVEGKPKQKVGDPISTKNAVCGGMCLSSSEAGSLSRRNMVQTALGKNMRHCLKNHQSKKGGRHGSSGRVPI
jgi:hypothetical protein